MNLTHVRQFVAVADELHFGRAATALGIPQPQLTRVVQALERSLGVHLMVRTTRHTVLTPAGLTFLQEARKLLAQAELARHLTQDAEAGGATSLRITFVAPALDFLPRALRVFRESWPNVEFVLERRSSVTQLEGLRDGSVDLGVLSTAGRNADGLNTRSVARYPYTALVPSFWDIARRDAIRLEELSEFSFLHPPQEQDPQVYKAIMLACQRAGFEPRTRIIQGPAQAYAIEAMVAAGEGLTLQPVAWKAIQLEGVTHLPIIDLPDYLFWEASAVWAPRAIDAPALDSLVGILCELGAGASTSEG